MDALSDEVQAWLKVVATIKEALKISEEDLRRLQEEKNRYKRALKEALEELDCHCDYCCYGPEEYGPLRCETDERIEAILRGEEL